MFKCLYNFIRWLSECFLFSCGYRCMPLTCLWLLSFVTVREGFVETTACYECGKEFETGIKTCPRCGAAARKRQFPARLVFVLVAPALFLALVCFLSPSQFASMITARPEVVRVPKAGDRRVVVTDSVWCLDMQDTKVISDLISAGKYEAYGKLAAQMGGEHKCIPFKKGTVIFVKEVSAANTLAQIRQKGDDRLFWIPYNMME